MKKLIDILLAVAITLGLSGCASTKTVRSFYSKPLNYDNPEYHFITKGAKWTTETVGVKSISIPAKKN